MDLGAAYTDQEMKKLTRQIDSIYKEAREDIDRKMKDFNERYKVKEAKYQKMVDEGKMSQEAFDNWKKGQVFQGKQWQAKKQDIENVLHNSNVLASNIVNSKQIDVFGFNLNYASYSMEHDAAINFGFNLYDRETVINLLRNEPNLLPNYIPKAGLDNAWNSKKITRQITLGIIQGERLDQIADRLARVTSSQNRNSMLTHARTLMTGAQNAGRLESYKNASKLGIDLEKEWMATLDGHTRDSHADIDGERVAIDRKFSNGCMYPGEAGAPPAEVYNCRCTMVSNIKKYPSYYSRRDNVTGKILNKLGPDTVANLTYRDWKITKGVMSKAKSAEQLEHISETLLKASQLGSGTVNYQVGSDYTSFYFMYKGFDSLFRKITTKSASKGITKEEYAAKITDALRFTNLSPAETLTQDYFTMVAELESQGYQMVEVSNTFVNYTSYRGINTLVKSPEGYVFELQFHTPQSMEIKEINHKLYEEERKLDKIKDADKIREIIATENKNAKSITTPIDVDQIVDIG